MSTLFIADPGLRSVSGHHPAAVTTLSKLRDFSRLVFFGHAQPDAGLTDWLAIQGAQFQPHFKKYLYEAYRKPWSLAEAQPYVRELAKDYAALFSEAKGEGPLHVLHHTLDWPHLSALALALLRAGQLNSDHTHHVFLMFNPGVGINGEDWDSRRRIGYQAALGSMQRFKNVRFYASGLELLGIYTKQFNLQQQIQLHPVFHFDAAAWRVDSQVSKAISAREKSVFLYAGDAKEAKGFLQLPTLVSAILASSKKNILVQIGVDERLCSAGIACTLEQLRNIAGSNSRFRLIERYVNEEELQDFFAQSLCFVFNYSPSYYAHQTSGMLWQAAAANVPVLVIGESWISREAPRVCGVTKTFPDPRSMLTWLCGDTSTESALRDLSGEEFSGDERLGFDSYRAAMFCSLDGLFAQPTAEIEVTSASLTPQLAGSTRTVLFIDTKLPNAASSAGGYAAVQEMRLFRSLGWDVRFLALSESAVDVVLAAELAALGVDVLSTDILLDKLLAVGLADCNLVFITRFNAAERVLTDIRRLCPEAKVWLNLADFHGLRMEREAKVLNDKAGLRRAKVIAARELDVMQQVDLVLSYTHEEISFIRSKTTFSGPLAQLPWVAPTLESRECPGFLGRAGVAFLAGFLHAPNVDAVTWFLKEVMPLLRKANPEIHFHVYGSHMPAALQKLADQDVHMHGYADHPGDVYDSCRVFLAPMRFGAGIKGKVISAMAHGVPTVCSAIAAEGIGGEESGLVICDPPEDWVDEILRVYSDETYWSQLSRQALRAARDRYSFGVAKQQLQDLLNI